jgi:uncharacterized LabA/DUF88 family protein
LRLAVAEKPDNPQAVAFIDGQNLFYAAKAAFGYTWPNYDPVALAQLVCARQGWNLKQTRFYTGVPDATDNAHWNTFWTNKLSDLGRRAVVFARPLRYHNKTVTLPDGKRYTTLVGQEKGIDIRIALDLVSLVLNRHYDVGLIFSQDQDLTEAVDEIMSIAHTQGRWVKLACAFPTSPTATNKRGINKTDWIKIARPEYDSCLDPKDYRPPKPNP